MGQDMTEGRRPHRTLLPDTVGSAPQKPTALQGRANTAHTDKQHRCRDLYGCLDAALLLDGWGDLHKPAARGVDGRTAHAYAVNLQANITAVVHRLTTHRSRAKLVRRCSIPQANGAARPWGSPALEDTVVPVACATRLMAIYAQDCLDGRDGERPGRGALEAVRDRTVDLQYGPDGSLGEADVQGCFDQLDHTRLLTRRRERSDARACLRLIRKGLKAGVLETDGRVVPPESGSPPGGSIAPVLANGYVHDALDGWCAQVVKAHCRGEARLCRSADDWVGACRYQDDAERCYRVVPARLKQCNLQVAPDKTPRLRCSRFHPSMRRRCTLLGVELVLEARPPRRAARHATHRAPEAPRGLPTDHGRDQTAPASAGTRGLPAMEYAAAGPLHLRRSARQLSLPPSRFRARSPLCVYMAQSARGEAAALSLGAVHSGSGPERESTAAHHGGQTPESVCMMATLCTAEARTTEEPDAGKLHVRDCTGGAG